MKEAEIYKRLKHFMDSRLQASGTINAMMEMEVVSLDISKKQIVLSFPVKKWQLNPAQHMHGGMISTAMDITMGCVSYIFNEADFTPTIQMSVNFAKGVNTEEQLLIEGYCDHGGSRIVQARAIAHVVGKEGVVATANGSYAVNRRQE